MGDKPKLLDDMRIREALKRIILSEENSDVKQAAIRTLPLETTDEYVDMLFTELKSDYPRTERISIISKIAGIKSPHAVDVLMNYLQDNPPGNYGGDAIRALGQLKDPRVIPMLCDFLKKSDIENFKGSAAYSLGQLGEAGVDALIKVLWENQPAKVKNDVFDGLAQSGDPRALQALMAYYSISPSDQREEAESCIATMVKKIPDIRALNILLTALKRYDGNDVSVLAGLSCLSVPQATDALIAALHNPDPSVRTTAIGGLNKQKDARFIDYYTDALKDPSRSVRQAAMHALGDLSDARVFDILFAYRHDSQKASMNVLDALATNPDPRITPMLVNTLLNSPRSASRNLAAYYLQRRKDSEAVNALTQALDDNWGVRQAALFALQAITGKSFGTKEEWLEWQK